MNIKFLIHLQGGLGNQMFQYAFGKNISSKKNGDLILDKKSGFWFDYRYKRKFELDKLNIKVNKLSLEIIFLFILEKFYRFFFIKKFGINFFDDYFLNEISHKKFYQVSLNKQFNKKNVFIKGYWQSEKYFYSIKNEIYNDFRLKESKIKLFKDMSKIIENSNSVSIGIRMYEEVPENSKSVVGGLANIKFYQKAIHKIKKQISNPIFFIFSTKNYSFIKDIIKDSEHYLINYDNGYIDSIDTLWLMSNCKNHIISNSSFYWWAAWLSEFKNKNSIIIASDNFANSDSIPDRWEKL